MRDKYAPDLREAQLVLKRVRDKLSCHPEWTEVVEEIDAVLCQLEAVQSKSRLSNGADVLGIVKLTVRILELLQDFLG